jgi:hypothetical protein
MAMNVEGRDKLLEFLETSNKFGEVLFEPL